jgi:hypothetical protein
MKTLRTYTPEENFRRIKRQKNLKFIVVEGDDDVAIYESCLIPACPEQSDYDIIFSGGKIAIRNFIKENKTNNAIFLIDKDFHDIGIEDNRLIILDRYSIENYFICEDVICASLQLALSCKLNDAKEIFDLKEFTDEICVSIYELLKVIFYHQSYLVKNLIGEKPKWSEVFLCSGNTWKICSIRVKELINDLAPDQSIIEAANEYFDTNFKPSDLIIKDFPGKLLRHSLQRFIFTKLSDIKPSASAKFGNVESMKILLASVMHRSVDLKKTLAPVVSFINNKK